jgi:SAM-dependent methyltransferase
MKSDSTTRFSARVENYVKYRPGYPGALIEVFEREFGFKANWTVADIGSGTGISTKLFLDHGNRVFAIEPNKDMQGAAESSLGGYPKFHSIAASADATTLPDRSVDLAVAAQAFHWFDPQTAGAEFRRILRRGGLAALIWNRRETDTSPFLRAYEELLLKYGSDYSTVRHEQVGDEARTAFFGTSAYCTANLPNAQHFDYEGLRGRLLSSSYAPLAGDPRHEPMLAGLREMFEQFQEDGRVTFAYTTEVFFAPLHDR